MRNRSECIRSAALPCQSEQLHLVDEPWAIVLAAPRTPQPPGRSGHTRGLPSLAPAASATPFHALGTANAPRSMPARCYGMRPSQTCRRAAGDHPGRPRGSDGPASCRHSPGRGRRSRTATRGVVAHRRHTPRSSTPASYSQRDVSGASYGWRCPSTRGCVAFYDRKTTAR
jgi:hypothetical protein